MKRAIFIIALSILVLVLALNFPGCGKKDAGDDDDDGGAKRALDENKSSCLEANYKSGDDDSSAEGNQRDIVIDFAQGTASFTHHYDPRNCAFSELVVTYKTGDGILEITEGEPARDGQAACGCCFNLDYAIPNLDAGPYVLKVTKKTFNGESFEYEAILSADVDFSAQTHYEFDLGIIYCE